MFDFSGKTVLITGASYGLGEGFATAFAAAGADLVLTARSAELLESVAEACRQQGAGVTAVAGDVSVEADVARVVATGVEERGRIDVLVNNAGVVISRGIAPEQFDMEEPGSGDVAVDLERRVHVPARRRSSHARPRRRVDRQHLLDHGPRRRRAERDRLHRGEGRAAQPDTAAWVRVGGPAGCG